MRTATGSSNRANSWQYLYSTQFGLTPIGDKSASSWEVTSMRGGGGRHDTEMDVEKQYGDTHGQSEVGLAFFHLLGFELLPRLKNLKKQRLYRPHKGERDRYANPQ